MIFLKVNEVVRVSKGIPWINLAGTPILRSLYAYSGASKDQLLAITTEVTACTRYRMYGHELHAKMPSIKNTCQDLKVYIHRGQMVNKFRTMYLPCYKLYIC